MFTEYAKHPVVYKIVIENVCVCVCVEKSRENSSIGLEK